MRRKLLAVALLLLAAVSDAATWVPAGSQAGCTAGTWCRIGSGAGTAGTWSELAGVGGPVAVLTSITSSMLGPPRWATECATHPNDSTPSRILLTLTISNTGGSPLTISSITGTEVAGYSPTLPASVVAGGSVQLLIYNNVCTYIAPTGTVYTNGGNLTF